MSPFQWHPNPLGVIPWHLELGFWESPKACIITFDFGFFLLHFRTSPELVIYSPETFLGVTCDLWRYAGGWHHLHCLEKPMNTPFFLFSWNPKLTRNEHKGIHIFVPSHMTPFQWRTMSLGGIRGVRSSGAEKSESVYYTFQFWLFLGHFRTSTDLVIYSPETFLADMTCNAARVLVTICIASKGNALFNRTC